jgi:hypothetical protein
MRAGGVSTPPVDPVVRRGLLHDLLSPPDRGAAALAWVDVDGAPRHLLRFDAESARVTHELRLPFGPLWLIVPAGCLVDRSTHPNRCVVRGDASAGIRMTFGNRPLAEQAVAIGLSGDADPANVTFTTTMAPNDLLDASIRYFYTPASPPISGTPGAAKAPAPIAHFVYPIFMPPAGAVETPPADAVPIHVRLDPRRPTDPSRNSVTLRSELPLPSAFRTTVGRALTLAVIPERSRVVPQWDPVDGASYLTLDGDWRLGTVDPPPVPVDLDVIGGLSGLEYAKVGHDSVMRFVAGAPAYAPNFPVRRGDQDEAALISAGPGSENPVTTAWIYFLDLPQAGPAAPRPVGPVARQPPAPRGYYAQPDAGGLFRINEGDPFLGVLTLQTADFPPDAKPVFGAPAASVPMAPYAGVHIGDPDQHALYRRFETEILSPTRGNAIYAMNWPSPAAAARAGATGAQAVPGPQALLDPASRTRTGAIAPPGLTGPLAVTPQGLLATFNDDYSEWQQLLLATTRRGAQRMELRFLCRELKSALLTNQLFLVVSDAKAFADCCEVDFPGLTMGGWGFTLAPQQWRSDTVMVFKFADQSLEQLIDDRSLWSAPGSRFNAGPATQGVLQRAVAYAKANAGQPEFEYFLNTVLKDWNGILFVNLAVPPGDFPDQLRGLASGIDFGALSAHHLGINLSPIDVRDGVIRTADASLFGLIDYNDPKDLTYHGTPYDFKVLSLRVLFANSDIASFASRIELLVGMLFGERSTLRDSAHGDNLVLNGVWQRHGGEDSYTFTEQGADTFGIDSHVLDTVLISKAQFITLPADPADPSLVSTRFVLWGSLRFRALTEADIFSFGPEAAGEPRGGLQFSNLFISMTSGGGADPTAKTFAFQAGQMAFDLAESSARPDSLYTRFPLQVTALAQGEEGTTPADLGYIPMQSPLRGGSLASTWFGLEMNLSLGTQGSLASKGGFAASLLAAWSPNASDYTALVGIRLPGSESGKRALTIQGPLTLSIGSLALLHDAAHRAYLMRFENIALGFFGLKFPPGGRTNLVVFGDPESRGQTTALGWYAAYKKDEAAKPQSAAGIAAVRRLGERIQEE